MLELIWDGFAVIGIWFVASLITVSLAVLAKKRVSGD